MTSIKLVNYPTLPCLRHAALRHTSTALLRHRSVQVSTRGSVTTRTVEGGDFRDTIKSKQARLKT